MLIWNKDHISGKLYVFKVSEALGRKLLDIEIEEEKDISSVTLHFEDGKELFIFRHSDGTLHVEGD